jgi:hypothetical protein
VKRKRYSLSLKNMNCPFKLHANLNREVKERKKGGNIFLFSICVFDQFNLDQIRLLSYQSAYLNMFMYSGKPNMEGFSIFIRVCIPLSIILFRARKSENRRCLKLPLWFVWFAKNKICKLLLSIKMVLRCFFLFSL